MSSWNCPIFVNFSSKTSEKKLSAYKIRVKNILQSLSNMEKEFKETKEASDAATVAEVGRIRQQVNDCILEMSVKLSFFLIILILLSRLLIN